MEAGWFLLGLAALAMPFLAWRRASRAEAEARALSVRVDRLWREVEQTAPGVRAVRREAG